MGLFPACALRSCEALHRRVEELGLLPAKKQWGGSEKPPRSRPQKLLDFMIFMIAVGWTTNSSSTKISDVQIVICAIRVES